MKTGYTVGVISFGSQYYFQKPSQLSRVNVGELITERAHPTAENYKTYPFTMIFVRLVQKSLMRIGTSYDSKPSHLINFLFINILDTVSQIINEGHTFI